GRVSFNPFVHVDLFGTVLLPIILLMSGAPFLFGYAKPVPVNFSRLNNPRRDMVLVALAGPAANILLVICAALLLHIVGFLPAMAGDWLLKNIFFAIQINAVLAAFNMLPIPPLDGGRGKGCSWLITRYNSPALVTVRALWNVYHHWPVSITRIGATIWYEF
ncbi:MAG: site-2 protease family protein, partial [Alphaproteobacteria bacterium]|nr:site-2 protease family protein [Alphaproteobacteria bacterium]